MAGFALPLRSAASSFIVKMPPEAKPYTSDPRGTPVATPSQAVHAKQGATLKIRSAEFTDKDRGRPGALHANAGSTATAHSLLDNHSFNF